MGTGAIQALWPRHSERQAGAAFDLLPPGDELRELPTITERVRYMACALALAHAMREGKVKKVFTCHHSPATQP